MLFYKGDKIRRKEEFRDDEMWKMTGFKDKIFVVHEDPQGLEITTVFEHSTENNIALYSAENHTMELVEHFLTDEEKLDICIEALQNINMLKPELTMDVAEKTLIKIGAPTFR
jgi:hypothetical protein